MESDPTELRRQKKSRIERLAALIGSTAALVTAVGAIYKPEYGARRAYDETSKQLEQLSKATQQNHADVAALRSYLDEYAKAHETVTVAPVGSASAATPKAPLTLKPTRPVSPLPNVSVKPAAFAPKAYKDVTGHEDVSMF